MVYASPATSIDLFLITVNIRLILYNHFPHQQTFQIARKFYITLYACMYVCVLQNICVQRYCDICKPQPQAFLVQMKLNPFVDLNLHNLLLWSRALLSRRRMVTFVFMCVYVWVCVSISEYVCICSSKFGGDNIEFGNKMDLSVAEVLYFNICKFTLALVTNQLRLLENLVNRKW